VTSGGRLEGRSALVTGGSRGIGRAIAAALAAEGAGVVLVARPSQDLDAAADEIGATAFAADLREPGAARRVVAGVAARQGPIEVLVNNAGQVGPFGATWEGDAGEWEAALRLNLVVPYHLVQAVLPEMLERRWGRILNVSSIVAARPLPRLGAYSASKAGIDAFTRQLGGELAGSGVSVAAIYPGPTDTAMHAAIRSQPAERVGPEFSAAFRGGFERGQVNPPDRVARLALAVLLRGEELNGQVVDIDGELGRRLSEGG
jgi:NAD(P)-dependent dehydrogenase (short-subunit alcohol dehydrogenase family)